MSAHAVAAHHLPQAPPANHQARLAPAHSNADADRLGHLASLLAGAAGSTAGSHPHGHLLAQDAGRPQPPAGFPALAGAGGLQEGLTTTASRRAVHSAPTAFMDHDHGHGARHGGGLAQQPGAGPQAGGSTLDYLQAIEGAAGAGSGACVHG